MKTYLLLNDATGLSAAQDLMRFIREQINLVIKTNTDVDFIKSYDRCALMKVTEKGNQESYALALHTKDGKQKVICCFKEIKIEGTTKKALEFNISEDQLLKLFSVFQDDPFTNQLFGSMTLSENELSKSFNKMKPVYDKSLGLIDNVKNHLKNNKGIVIFYSHRDYNAYQFISTILNEVKIDHLYLEMPDEDRNNQMCDIINNKPGRTDHKVEFYRRIIAPVCLHGALDPLSDIIRSAVTQGTKIFGIDVVPDILNQSIKINKQMFAAQLRARDAGMVANILKYSSQLPQDGKFICFMGYGHCGVANRLDLPSYYLTSIPAYMTDFHYNTNQKVLFKEDYTRAGHSVPFATDYEINHEFDLAVLFPHMMQPGYLNTPTVVSPDATNIQSMTSDAQSRNQTPSLCNKFSIFATTALLLTAVGVNLYLLNNTPKM